MRAPDRRLDDAALERLREHEIALGRRLETTRADAERARAEAREEADRIRREGAAVTERDVAAALQAAAVALEEELRARREEAERAVLETRERAARGRLDAVACAVAAASGGVP